MECLIDFLPCTLVNIIEYTSEILRHRSEHAIWLGQGWGASYNGSQFVFIGNWILRGFSGIDSGEVKPS